NNTHSSSGTSRSTKSVMHGSTNDHAKRNDVLALPELIPHAPPPDDWNTPASLRPAIREEKG
ncbi:hypothetical protein AB0F11_38150, partial [Streptomyces sp. NPDC032472]|uniref:hypothetical protein n=1 Tax=Streptomyces sp. NPDC032472 TaxID=3155018 RepID=UPI0033C4CADB